MPRIPQSPASQAIQGQLNASDDAASEQTPPKEATSSRENRPHRGRSPAGHGRPGDLPQIVDGPDRDPVSSLGYAREYAPLPPLMQLVPPKKFVAEAAQRKPTRVRTQPREYRMSLSDFLQREQPKNK